jgi:hypothetical protein
MYYLIVGDNMAQDPNWIELYDYVKYKILGYDESIKLPKYFVLRLKGLQNGQHIANKNHQQNAKYDYQTILTTFKICRPQIINMIEKNKTTYKDENHMINSIMCIIDKEINNVVLKLKSAKKAIEKTENLKLDNQSHETAEYKTKSKEIKKELEDLW